MTHDRVIPAKTYKALVTWPDVGNKWRESQFLRTAWAFQSSPLWQLSTLIVLLYAVSLVPIINELHVISVSSPTNDFGIRKSWIQFLPLPFSSFVWFIFLTLGFLMYKMGF